MAFTEDRFTFWFQRYSFRKTVKKREHFFPKKLSYFQNFKKSGFFFDFWSKKYHPVVILAREALFWHQKSLFRKFDFFSDLSVFWVKFSKNWVKNSKIKFKFFQKLLIFSHFFYPRALLTTRMTDWTLQNINNSISLAVNSLRKGHFCPPTSKKILIKNEV